MTSEMKVTAAMVEFDITEYVFSTGHAPRGRGSWAFEFEPGKPEWTRIEQNGVTTCSMTYGEAKRWATRQAIARGITYVKVCS